MLTPAEALTPPTTPPIKPPMAVPIPGQMHEPIAAPAQAPPVPPTAPAPLQAVRLPNSFPDILPEQSLTVSGMTLTVKAAVAVITFVEAVREGRLRAAAPVSARLPTPSAVFSITFRPTPERMAASMTLLALFCRTAVVARPALVLRNCCVATPAIMVLVAVFPAWMPEALRASPLVAPWLLAETKVVTAEMAPAVTDASA